MNEAFNFVLDTIGDTWVWLTTWNFHNVSFAFYLVGIIVLSMLIDRIFG